MKITCYIIDDTPPEASLVIEYVHRTDELQLLGYEADPAVALSRLLSGEVKPDVCFLEIRMSSIDGLEIGRAIKHLCCVVFITGFTEYVSEAYELDATDYLLKPVPYLRFLKCIEKVKRSLSTTPVLNEVSYFFIKDVNSCTIIRVNIHDLQVIEGNGNFVKLHLRDVLKPVMTNLSMTKILELIRSVHFVQVHKSYIINLLHVVSLMGNEITLTNGFKVTVSRNFKSHFTNKLNGINNG